MFSILLLLLFTYCIQVKEKKIDPHMSMRLGLSLGFFIFPILSPHQRFCAYWRQ
jgi:hypothetical protein